MLKDESPSTSSFCQVTFQLSCSWWSGCWQWPSSRILSQ